MRRRHLLALVILALVVATVMAFGPVRVFDAMMTKQVTVYWPNGNLRLRYYTWRWQAVRDDALEPRAFSKSRERWYENGQKRDEFFVDRFVERVWEEDGRLVLHASPSGNFRSTLVDGKFVEQELWSGDVVERRTSPPWFTEEEILQAVEGVER